MKNRTLLVSTNRWDALLYTIVYWHMVVIALHDCYSSDRCQHVLPVPVLINTQNQYIDGTGDT
jgi:hypothetical protein